jgi:60 kDa SS-A/Ro ribonucleoprotein
LVHDACTPSGLLQVHPTKALQRYRKEMNMPHAKLVVLAFSVTEFSIADPDDPGMMDIAGLDSAVPRIIREFALGRL